MQRMLCLLEEQADQLTYTFWMLFASEKVWAFQLESTGNNGMI